MSTREALSKSNLTTSRATPRSTSSPASADGALQPASLAGQTTALCGQPVVHAHLGPEPVSGTATPQAQQMSATCGRSSSLSLIEQSPPQIFGEQVSGKKVQPWIKRTKRDLTDAGYAFHGEDRRARDYEAPQGRERFFFFADLGGARGQGLVSRCSAGPTRPWRWRGQKDLRAIADAPFQPGDRWPQPLLRRGDDGLSARVASLRAYGNAIDPWVAAQFIRDAIKADGVTVADLAA